MSLLRHGLHYSHIAPKRNLSGMLEQVDLLKHSARRGGGVAGRLSTNCWKFLVTFLPFLEENTDLGPATRSKMLSILHDPSKKTYLMLEIAAVVDAGRQFVQTTYNLEGDGPLVLQCYEQIEVIFQSIQVRHFPNTDAVITQLSSGLPSHIGPQWRLYAESCVRPGFDYFTSRFNG